MRVAIDNWRSGELSWETGQSGLDDGFRITAFSSDDNLGGLQHMSTCACAGCLTKLAEHYTADNALTPPVLQIVEPPDIAGNTTTTATLAIGGSETGALQVFGDDDWFAVQLVAGQSYVFTLTPSGGTPMQDPYLQLYNTSGSLVAFDDDGATGTNSLLRWTATDSGTFYINARAWEEDGASGGYTGTGSYTITAAIGAPQNPLDTINLGITAPMHIDVYFSTSGQTQSFGPPGNQLSVTALRSWTPEEIALAMAALQVYSTYTNLTFSQTTSQAQAEFILTLGDLETGTLGWFSTYAGIGYGAFAPDGTGWTTGANGGLNQGGLGWVTLIHEFGHGLGLAHPHDNGGISEVMQGVLGPFNDTGTFGLNQGVYTTMTYNDGWFTRFGSGTVAYGSQGTPMALDIALLQQRYGARANVNQTDTTYVMPTVNQSGTHFSSIWDTGGVDTIIHDGSVGATIDLRPASLLNAVGGGGWVSSVNSIQGGFTIANGVLIENATGGSGDDTLVGNDANNILDGRGGADTMVGGNGDDTYFVNNFGDLINESFNAGTDTVQASVNGYQLSSNTENLTLVGVNNGVGNELNNIITGNDLNNTLTGNDGNDQLIGANGNDVLNGGAQSDSLDGGAGADQLSGGDGDDFIYADSFDTLISGGAGVDWVYFLDGGNATINAGTAGIEVVLASSGNDTINAATVTVNFYTYAGAGNDIVTGGSGDDGLYGQDGNDTISGGLGADLIWGEGGADSLSGGDGDDTFIADSLDTLISGGAGVDWVYFIDGLPVTFDAGANSVEVIVVVGSAADAFNAAAQTAVFTVYASGGNDTITGGSNNDNLYGQDGNDTIVGGGGNDLIWGEGGVDSLSGGDGDDTIIADSTDSLVSGGDGVDWVYYIDNGNVVLDAGARGVEVALTGSGADTLNAATQTANFAAYAGGGADIITGGTGNDGLFGQDGDDTISGGNGNDVLLGEGGSDILNGGAGGDIIAGGAEADTFVYQAGWGGDSVLDFQNGVDQFDMTALAANGVTSIANLTISTSGLDAIISWNGNLIVVQNAAGQIDSSDFIFGP